MTRVGTRSAPAVTRAVAVAGALLLIASACASNKSGGSASNGNKPYCAGRTVVLESAGVGDNEDVQFRAMAPKLSEVLGCDVKVVNAPGGDNDVAQNLVHASKPDGLTVGYLGVSKDIYTAAIGKPEINFSVEDVQFIASSQGAPNVFVAMSNSPYKTFDDLLNAQPPASILIAGARSSGSMTIQLMFAAYGKKPKLVSGYNGSSGIVQGLLRGDGPVTANPTSVVGPLILQGKARPLLMDVAAQPGTDLYNALKDVPVYADFAKTHPPTNPDVMQHLIDYRAAPSDWFFAAKNTPQNVVDQLRNAFKKTMTDPAVSAKLAASGVYGYVPGTEGQKTIQLMESITPYIKQYATQ